MKYVWKVTELKTVGDELTAKYHASLIGDITIETEGYWNFPEAGTVPFAEVTEEMIAQWIEDSSMVDGKNVIKSRLTEQLESLSKKPVPAPWLPQVFTPDL